MDTNDIKAVNPVPVRQAGSYIRKSVLYCVLTYISSLAIILFFILFIIRQVMPAIMNENLNTIMNNHGLTLLLLLMVFSIISLVLWILSLSTLNKAGLLLVPVNQAGSYIRKSVLYRVLTYISSFAIILFFILFIKKQVMPAIMNGESNDIMKTINYGLSMLLLSLFFSIISLVFWILSLTTLNKAGLLLISVNQAGSYIRKSVLYSVLTYISSLAIILFFILFINKQVMPGIMRGESLIGIHCNVTMLLLSFYLSIISLVFWILSLTTLNKSGLLLKESDNLNLDSKQFKIEPGMIVALLSILTYILIQLYFIIRPVVGYYFQYEIFKYYQFKYILSPLIVLIFAFIGVYMALRKIKWTFIAGGVNLLITIYFFIHSIILKPQHSSLTLVHLLVPLINFILLSVFVYTTFKDYWKSRKP